MAAMKPLAVALLTVSVLAVAPAAMACVPAPYHLYRPAVPPSALPAQMVAAAAFVDVVIAERVDLLDPDVFLAGANDRQLAALATDAERAAYRQSLALEHEDLRAGGFGRIHFHVVERLKGPAAAGFTLIGLTNREAEPELFRSPAQARAERGGYGTRRSLYQAQRWVQANEIGIGNCTMPLAAAIGERYLIFRDARGDLLGEVRDNTGPYRDNIQTGSVVEPVADDDPWLARVRRAAAKAR